MDKHGRSLAAFAGLGGAIVVLLAGTAPASAKDGEESRPRAVEGEIVVALEGGGQRLVRVAEERVSKRLRKLRRSGQVRWAHRNWVARSAGQPDWPDDPGIGGTGGWRAHQWNFLGHDTATGIAGASVEGAWAIMAGTPAAGGAGVTIAVVDTGIAYRKKGKRYARSPDFSADRFVPGHDFIDRDRIPLDDDGHGTHVAGTIGEDTHNGVGLAGIAYAAKLMPVRVLDSKGRGSAWTIARGIRWATNHGADIINLSLEFPTCKSKKRCVRTCAQIKSVCKAMRRAVQRGVLIVAAAGNVGKKGGTKAVAYPARLNKKGVVAVGATTKDGSVASYSRRGKRLDLVAPGGAQMGYACVTEPKIGVDAITQMSFRGKSRKRFCLQRRSGTSMAAAHVTGAAALILASGVMAGFDRPGEIERQLRCSAYVPEQTPPQPHMGAGLLDVATALKSSCIHGP